MIVERIGLVACAVIAVAKTQKEKPAVDPLYPIPELSRLRQRRFLLFKVCLVVRKATDILTTNY